MMSTSPGKQCTAAAQRVLQRAEISRLSRTLKCRLGLASFKAQRGLHNVSFDALVATTANSNSNSTATTTTTTTPPASSPTQMPPSLASPRPRLEQPVTTSPVRRKRKREAGPAEDTPTKQMRVGDGAGSSSLYTSPMTPRPSHSHSHNRPASPPPSTPPRTEDQQGADLLMYLATSPSPAQKKPVPRTPTNLNSSPMLFQTPQQFNLNDYLHIHTPSPARKRHS